MDNKIDVVCLRKVLRVRSAETTLLKLGLRFQRYRESSSVRREKATEELMSMIDKAVLDDNEVDAVAFGVCVIHRSTFQ